MSKVGRIIILGIMFALGMACAWNLSSTAPAQEKAAKVGTKWEYKILTMTSGNAEPIQDSLNKFGSEGYKVSFTTSSSASNTGGGMIPTTTFLMERAKP